GSSPIGGRLRSNPRGRHRKWGREMKVVFVTERLPYGSHEAFLMPELRECLRSGHELVIVPLVSGGESTHTDARFLHKHVRTVRLRRPRVLADVAMELVRHPVRSARLLWLALRSGRLS